MLQLSSTEIFSIILNIVLAVVAIVQIVAAKKEQEKDVAKVRIWHKQAEGIKDALAEIVAKSETFGSKHEMVRAIEAIAKSATTLDESFAEDRFYNDDEVKAKREHKEKKQIQLMSLFKGKNVVKKA